MSKRILIYPRKGSAEAYAWAAKMQAARAKKKKQIQALGSLREAQYFGPGGHVTGAALHKKKRVLSHAGALKAAQALVEHEAASLNPLYFVKSHAATIEEFAKEYLLSSVTRTGQNIQFRGLVLVGVETPDGQRVFIGYDQKRKEFIVQDSGPRHNPGKRFPEWYYDPQVRGYILDLGKDGVYMILPTGSGFRLSHVVGTETAHLASRTEIEDLMDYIDKVFKRKVKRPAGIYGSVRSNPSEESAKQTLEFLKANLKAPYVNGYVSGLGGKERASILLTVSLDSQESWKNGILENSNYAKFHIGHDGVIEQISGYGVKRFRKSRVKDAQGMLEKLSRWIAESSGGKQNPCKSYAENPLAIYGNPPQKVEARVEGVIYNRIHEIRAEKTKWKKGPYKHPFDGNAQILALDNGDLLVHSTDGKRLWERH